MNELYELPLDEAGYSFGFLDEYAKREIRRAVIKAICVPGYQTPYASREMPMGRGFGTGGLQLTLSLVGPDDTLKVIDQGSDDSVNAVNLRHFVELTCEGVQTTEHTGEATLIQSRHRIPEVALTEEQILDMYSAASTDAPRGLMAELIGYLRERRRFEKSRWLPAVRDCEAPVQICWGADDAVAPVAIARRLKSEVRPDAKLIVIDGLGHFAQIQDPEAWFEALSPFWAE